MIQAQELRKDNLVATPLGYWRVMEIKMNAANCVNEHGTTNLINYQYMNPIPLSPELLEKCGFKRKTNDNERNIYWLVCKGREFQFATDFAVCPQFPVIFYEINKFGMTYSISEIKYLHELQNLIKCLTQTELEVKL